MFANLGFWPNIKFIQVQAKIADIGLGIKSEAWVLTYLLSLPFHPVENILSQNPLLMGSTVVMINLDII